MEETKVILVTVTYNSSHFLKRLVGAVAAETYQVKKLIVVDNASNADHKKVINELATRYPFMEIIVSDENLGGAGGFEKGMQYVLDQNYDCDCVWIMDDDAFPRAECLQILVDHLNKDIGAVVPLIFGVEQQQYQLYHHKKESKYLNADICIVRTPDELKDGMPVETNAFVGPLVKMNVIRDIGVPDGSLFIYGDDTEYMYRVSRKYKVVLAKDAVINHRDVFNKNNEINKKDTWKTYYKYRNRFLFIEKYKNGKMQGVIGKVMVLKDIARDYIGIITNPKYREVRQAKKYCINQAVKDGLKNKGGKTLDPQKFNEKYVN